MFVHQDLLSYIPITKETTLICKRPPSKNSPLNMLFKEDITGSQPALSPSVP